jgi:transposase
MIVVGVDAHKRVHVAVALDEAGRELGERRAPNNAGGWRSLIEWAASLPGPRVWGIEGAWGYGRRLAQQAVSEGETVFEVNPRWTALGRRRARKPDKSDRLDARAVAQFVRQDTATLPRVTAEDVTAVLDLLTTEREGALTEATRLRNQIHALLLQVEPDYRGWLKTFRSKAALAALEHYAPPGGGLLHPHRVIAVRRLAARLRLAQNQADELAREIETIAAEHFSALTQLCGVSLLTAGALAGILGPGRRFSSEAQLAAYAGAAPLEASSAGHVRHRLNRGGNRRLNCVLYRIVLTQASHLPRAKAYLERRVSEGKSRREARRALARYVARAVWRLWQECLPASVSPSMEQAA